MGRASVGRASVGRASVGRASVGSDRHARRQARAQEFGRRHPRLTLAICIALLAAAMAIDGYQLSYGTYLGLVWVIAAAAGMAAAAGLAAVIVLRRRRRRPVPARLVTAWLVLALASAGSIRLPFPRGPYGGLQAVVSMVKAALLGYEAVTCAGLIALCGYAFLRSSRARRPDALAPRSPGRAALPARLRFPGAGQPAWRAGRLIAANGTVTWRSLNGDAEVDLTPACQALPVLPDDSRRRQPRTTVLATASGLAEVDVSPRALTSLARILQHPHG